MNDRDKTDVWSTSGVILIIFFQVSICFCFTFYSLRAAGYKREGGEREKEGKFAKAFRFMPKHVWTDRDSEAASCTLKFARYLLPINSKDKAPVINELGLASAASKWPCQVYI